MLKLNAYAMLVSGISIVVGLYSLLSAVIWLFWTAAPAEFHRFFLPFHVALFFTATATMLAGIHSLKNESRRKMFFAVTGASSVVVLALALMAAGGYSIDPRRTGLFWLRQWPNYPLLRSILGPATGVIGLLLFSRRIGPWALMAGGGLLLAAQVFLAFQAMGITPVVAALISIGFILEGSHQYQEQAFHY